jgi:predicted nucleic acid-binding protein
VQVVICHPKLVETGLDLLDFPTIIFYESGYSLHTLRQASRRSWRIGQRLPVRVKLLCYEGTMQTAWLRLMGKKLLVALTGARRILADFLIGAHAHTSSYRLLTLDERLYKEAFPTLTVETI